MEFPDLLLILHCQSPIFVDCSPNSFNIFGCSACWRPSRTSIALNGFPAIFEASAPQFYLSFTHWIIPESLLNHWNSFHGRMSKIQAKLDADSLIYSLCHCESDGRTVHKLRQRHPTNDWLAPREFTHAQKGLLWLAAKLHQGHATGSRNIKYGWILSRQTLYYHLGW